MKSNIHPTYYKDTIVTCSCGNTFVTGSTKKAIHVEICAKCHPFFTGELKFIDTLGTVDKFLKKQAAAVGYINKKKKIASAPQEFKTLKDMLTVSKTAK
jgi:large subunit ribosomal protein L31